MTDADLWLILDAGVVIGDLAYATRAAAESDALVLRAEASAALGYEVSDGQIEVWPVRVVAAPQYRPRRGEPAAPQGVVEALNWAVQPADVGGV